jgi:threonine synthase
VRLTSTRDARQQVPFKQAVVSNAPAAEAAPEALSSSGGPAAKTAAGGGLYAPVALAPWPDVEDLLRLPWLERSTEILDRLLGDEYPRAELARMARQAFDFPLPLVEVEEDCFALELFHGPSFAFKDFGARFLAAVLAGLRQEGAAGRTVLTATSGDTGAAVAAAFWQRDGFRVVVLYPEGRVSPLQERQLACLGGNVVALAVAGDFDDCQRLVRACFADAELCAELRLVAANSINIARLVAQLLYYFEGLAQLRRLRPAAPAPVIAVPSGNFGNLCAGLYARALGLPAGGFVAATNANRVVPDFLDGGPYRPRPGIATLSNAMDVGNPSNWERILHLYGGDAAAVRRVLRWGVLDDAATAVTLGGLARRGYRADPHAAVAYGVLRRVLRAGEVGIFLATAHPAKFDAVLAPLGLAAPLPGALAALLDRPLARERLSAGVAPLKARLRDLN